MTKGGKLGLFLKNLSYLVWQQNISPCCLAKMSCFSSITIMILQYGNLLLDPFTFLQWEMVFSNNKNGLASFKRHLWQTPEFIWWWHSHRGHGEWKRRYFSNALSLSIGKLFPQVCMNFVTRTRPVEAKSLLPAQQLRNRFYWAGPVRGIGVHQRLFLSFNV